MHNLLQQDKDHIWHPFTPLIGGPAPTLITAGKGVYLHTQDGRRILDAVSSWWVNLHGHSNPVIAEAVAEQARTLEHVIFAGFTHEPAIKLSENLLTILPDSQQRIFFSDNGSTAVEVGIKMSLQYFYNRGIEKKKVIALQGAYHGDTFGAMSVGERGLFTKPFFPYLFDVAFIDFPSEDKEAEVITQFESLVKKGDVCSFIYEPLVQASAGMRIYSPDVLDKLVAIAQQHDVICIADEVFTGFGRTGKWFASQYLQHPPDIMSLSKGLTGGTMAFGVTTCSDKIASAFKTEDFSSTFFHGHSYTANPLACAAANASFKLLTQPETKQSIERIAARHNQFKSSIEADSKLTNVRTLGTIIALEIKVEDAKYEHKIRDKIFSYFIERDILLRPLGNIIYILPPYVITDDELDLLYRNIREFINSL